jgi:maltooligosyltrehalose trehalohydrolase
LVLDTGASYPSRKAADGTWLLTLQAAAAGTRYRYLVDGRGPFPDPASRFQPEGVHGPSEVIDPGTFPWPDRDWGGRSRDDLVFYELHVGTFTPEGTFAALQRELPRLVELGVNAIELMPIGDFPGQRNWGYDGVSLCAPARCYGRPEELRALVARAHQLGLAIFLDVVYNHFGPDGNYTGVYSPYFFSKKHHTPWGDAINFDGPQSPMVRAFFIENALHWIHEYHLDGLRLDATHAIMDDSPHHILAELAACVHESVTGRRVHLIAEDHRNLAHMVRPEKEGGWGLDGIWADDFHHELRRLLAGDSEGYYRDYSGTTADLATTINQGWFFTGQHSEHLGGPRGTDPAGLPPRSFIVCLQNHDQIGNRALGERFSHQIDPAANRAATVLLLCSPATPLLFMGQEWAASTPFLFFTDHNPELGKLVTEGRRKEFRNFSAFTEPESWQKIPDPQALSTFEVSRLNASERVHQPYRGVWELHRALLELRRQEPALRNAAAGSFVASTLGLWTLVLRREAPAGPGITVICHLRGSGDLVLDDGQGRNHEMILSTEEMRFTDSPAPILVQLDGSRTHIQFTRPGAVILRRR